MNENMIQFYCLHIVGIQKPLNKHFYEEASGFVEKWTKIIHFFLSKIASQSLISGFIVLSYILYFIVDLKEDSFYLLFNLWYKTL